MAYGNTSFVGNTGFPNRGANIAADFLRGPGQTQHLRRSPQQKHGAVSTVFLAVKAQSTQQMSFCA